MSVPLQCPTIPITDDPFSPAEIDDAIQVMKANRGGGPSGIPPGILKILPASWVVFLTIAFNMMFMSTTFPVAWSLSRLIVIFKKGARTSCDNYPGIAIMDSFAKLFDLLLCRRLEKWFCLDREQAGAQKGRGCLEHILSLRLLIDYATSKKVKLFIIYVDFSKAYDRVPRRALIELLSRFGCGYLMVAAISCLYSDTKIVLGAAIITATIGLRQGSPTSCFLFTLYINGLVRRIKSACPNDGFLGWIHCLLLMDDTILLSTTREGCLAKLTILQQFCEDSGMVINQSKTKFMLIHGSNIDRSPLISGSLTVDNCEAYTYLGSVFTQDGKIESALKCHLVSKQPHVMKFTSFVTKNCDFPFWVKQVVCEAALFSSVLYGCESWLCNGAKVI